MKIFKKVKKQINKSRRQLRGVIPFGNTCTCSLMVLFLLVGLYAGNSLGLFQAGFNTTTTTTTTHTTTPTTTTTTPDTTTTTTQPVLHMFDFKVMWDFVPIMDIDPPAWLLVEIYTDETLGDYCDGVYLTAENIWFYGVYDFHFRSDTSYRIYITGANGFDEFELSYNEYDVISPWFVSMYWDTTQGEDDWGNLYLQWLEV